MRLQFNLQSNLTANSLWWHPIVGGAKTDCNLKSWLQKPGFYIEKCNGFSSLPSSFSSSSFFLPLCRQNSDAKPYLLEIYHLKPTAGHTILSLIHEGRSRSAFTTLKKYLTGLPRNDFGQFHFPHYAQLSSDISPYLRPFYHIPNTTLVRCSFRGFH